MPSSELNNELRNAFRDRKLCPDSFDMSTPPMSARYPPDSHRVACEAAAKASQSPHGQQRRWAFHQWICGLQGRCTVGAVIVLLAGVIYMLFWQPHGSTDRDSSDEFGGLKLDSLYAEKLKSISLGVKSLENLSAIVVKADDTYEDVYHNQLVQQTRDASRDTNEADWNGFVKEARLTGPVFLAGKEKLREAVANMQRLIRRAPEYLRSMVQWLSKKNAEEASWYLSKVVKLVDQVHSSMNEAADQFASAETTMSGMTRDAKENADHFENRASSLEGEVKALEGTPVVSTGRWARRANQALYGCQLEKTRASLADCKMKCVDHETGSCRQITYYITAAINNCYLHCESGAPSIYSEADTYVLERAPAELAHDMTVKSQAAVAAVGLKRRWRKVQAPLQEVAQLVRRFRGATADLRGSLEDARFATDDLLAAFKSSATAHEKGADTQVRVLERQVEEVVAAIEDLGDSLAMLRFQ